MKIEKSLICLKSYNTSFSYKGVYGSLLDVLEAHHILIEFQCRSGYCGTCRLKLITGKVKYLNKPLAFIGHEEILPCCCLPIGNIELDF